MLKTCFKKDEARGFTMVEMMVSVGIIVAFTAFIALNQSNYTSGTQLKNDVDTISLYLKQAQIYGLSVKDYSPGATQSYTQFASGYGVHFYGAGQLGRGTYVLFVDYPTVNGGQPDGIFQGDSANCTRSQSNECLESRSLSGNNRVTSICVITQLSPQYAEDCRSVGGNGVDVTFVRPNIIAKIIFDGNAGAYPNPLGVRIEFGESARAPVRKSIYVYTTGQISVR